MEPGLRISMRRPKIARQDALEKPQAAATALFLNVIFVRISVVGAVTATVTVIVATGIPFARVTLARVSVISASAAAIT
jgi:hypothetical protein